MLVFLLNQQSYKLFHKLVSKSPFVIQIFSFVFICLHQNCRWIIEIEMEPTWNLSHIFDRKSAWISPYQGVIRCQPAVPAWAGPARWPFSFATRSETDCVFPALALRMLTLLGLWCSMMSAEPPPSSRLISRRYGRLWLPVRSVPPLPYGCRQLSDNFGHLKPPDLVICQAALYVIHRAPVYRGLPYLLRPPPIVCLAQYSIASLSISSSVLLRVSDIRVSISDRLKKRCFPLL